MKFEVQLRTAKTGVCWRSSNSNGSSRLMQGKDEDPAIIMMMVQCAHENRPCTTTISAKRKWIEQMSWSRD